MNECGHVGYIHMYVCVNEVNVMRMKEAAGILVIICTYIRMCDVLHNMIRMLTKCHQKFALLSRGKSSLPNN